MAGAPPHRGRTPPSGGSGHRFMLCLNCPACVLRGCLCSRTCLSRGSPGLEWGLSPTLNVSAFVGTSRMNRFPSGPSRFQQECGRLFLPSPTGGFPCPATRGASRAAPAIQWVGLGALLSLLQRPAQSPAPGVRGAGGCPVGAQSLHRPALQGRGSSPGPGREGGVPRAGGVCLGLSFPSGKCT